MGIPYVLGGEYVQCSCRRTREEKRNRKVSYVYALVPRYITCASTCTYTVMY